MSKGQFRGGPIERRGSFISSNVGQFLVDRRTKSCCHSPTLRGQKRFSHPFTSIF